PAGAPHRHATLEGIGAGLAVAAGALLLFQNVLVHDALWYYTYLRSALVDGDLDLFAEFALRNPNGMYLPPPGTPIFHLGTGLLAAPLAILARPIALLLDRAGILPGGDGYGALEVAAVTVTSLLLAAGAVVLAHRLARGVAPAGASLLAITALVYASPFAWFAFVWPAYPHAASACLAAAFLLWWRTRGAAARPATLFGMGLLGGLLALVHPQDAIYLALPLLDLAGAAQPLAGVAALGAGALVGFAPQMAAWAAAAGAPVQNVYGAIGDPFRFAHPAFLEVFFSGYNGLFTWTPLCGVAVAGLFLVRRRDPRLFRGLVVVLALETWAIASYGYWWGGASFGARYFLSAWPVFAVGLAAATGEVMRRAGAAATGALLAPFVYWNLLLMAQFRLEWIPHNRPPDFAAAIARQVHEAPAALVAGLLMPFRWNRVLAIDTLGAAIATRSIAGLLAWGVIAGGGIALLLVLCGWLARVTPPRRLDAGRLGVAGATAALVVTLAVGAAASEPGRRRVLLAGDRLPRTVAAGQGARILLVTPPEGPTAEAPTAVALAVRRTPRRDDRPRTLSLVTYLRRAALRSEGEPTALVTVEGRGCAAARHLLRAGFETAETAPDRVEVEAIRRHDATHADPIERWWQDDQSAAHYWGQSYLATFLLPIGCEPESLRLVMTGGPGDLVVRRALVSEDLPERAAP
ncbi:MAG TPA: hypothetical protein VMQ62_12995, partial [Dongiaceae bacterium]|nr:hypothetical protein [Dongiaceae bacterium]